MIVIGNRLNDYVIGQPISTYSVLWESNSTTFYFKFSSNILYTFILLLNLNVTNTTIKNSNNGICTGINETISILQQSGFNSKGYKIVVKLFSKESINQQKLLHHLFKVIQCNKS